ncbi:MAG TPA: DUF3159 domain-containing protein [Mycobacteriales bacterium]
MTEADGQPRSAARPTPMLVESIGGWRGLVDSGLPVVVFVAVNAVADLRAAIWAAIAAGVVLFAIRLARKQTVQQALSGFFGVLVAAFIAHRTGEAKGFFLLGIWASFTYGAVFLVSALVRWPVVGLIWEYVDGRDIGTAWRRDRRLMRVYTWCTLLWVAVFLARGLVQRYLYDQDATGWLAVARLAMGYPFTIGAVAVSVLAVRRVRKIEEAEAEDARAAAEPGAAADVAVTRPEA